MRSLREWRLMRGWGVAELARAAGVTRWTVARLERGLRVRPGAARRIAQVLGVSPWEIKEYWQQIEADLGEEGTGEVVEKSP